MHALPTLQARRLGDLDFESLSTCCKIFSARCNQYTKFEPPHPLIDDSDKILYFYGAITTNHTKIRWKPNCNNNNNNNNNNIK